MSALKYIGYVAFFLFAFVISLYLTFPWGSAKDFVLVKVSKQSGMQITADRLEPSWITGLEAEGVAIETSGAEEPIEIPRLEARAKVLSFLTGGRGATLSMPIAQGTVDADLEDDDARTKVEAHVKGVELALVPGLEGMIGVPLTGKINLDADLDLDKEKPEASSGVLSLGGAGLELQKGGKVGGMTLPFALDIGDFQWRIPIADGKAKLDKLAIEGGSVELVLDGTVTLAPDPSRSMLNLVVKFKPTDAFLKKEPLLGALLNNIRQAKGPDGFYAYALTGSVKHPRFFMKRGG